MKTHLQPVSLYSSSRSLWWEALRCPCTCCASTVPHPIHSAYSTLLHLLQQPSPPEQELSVHPSEAKVTFKVFLKCQGPWLTRHRTILLSALHTFCRRTPDVWLCYWANCCSRCEKQTVDFQVVHQWGSEKSSTQEKVPVVCQAQGGLGFCLGFVLNMWLVSFLSTPTFICQWSMKSSSKLVKNLGADKTCPPEWPKHGSTCKHNWKLTAIFYKYQHQRTTKTKLNL